MFSQLQELINLHPISESAGSAFMLVGKPLKYDEAAKLTATLKSHFGGSKLINCDEDVCRIRIFCKSGCSMDDAKAQVEEKFPGWLQRVSKVPMAEELHLDEEKSASSDFEGINSIVSDCLADIDEKVDALLELARQNGIDKLDTVKDADGHTVLKKIRKMTTDYKKQMEKLMMEVEVMMMQVVDKK
jgi:hypothetical protein